MVMEPLNASLVLGVIFEKLLSIYFNHEWRISDFYENSVIHLFAFCLPSRSPCGYLDDEIFSFSQFVKLMLRVLAARPSRDPAQVLSA